MGDKLDRSKPLHGGAGLGLLARIDSQKPRPSGARDVSLASAIRYVVEELSGDKRPRAVVHTATALLFINEIEALYEQSEFPKAHLTKKAVRSQG